MAAMDEERPSGHAIAHVAAGAAAFERKIRVLRHSSLLFPRCRDRPAPAFDELAKARVVHRADVGVPRFGEPGEDVDDGDARARGPERRALHHHGGDARAGRGPHAGEAHDASRSRTRWPWRPSVASPEIFVTCTHVQIATAGASWARP